MTWRYVLAPEAVLDLLQIWRYIKKQSSVEIADRVESVIRDKIVFLATNVQTSFSIVRTSPTTYN
jgi:plasmid stabilization system protein ParE